MDWRNLVAYAMLITGSVGGASVYASYNGADAKTDNNIVFYSLALAQLFHVFSMVPASASFFRNEITNNLYVWGALAICILILQLTYYNGLLREVLAIQDLSQQAVLIIFAAGILPVVLIRILKLMKVLY